MFRYEYTCSRCGQYEVREYESDDEFKNSIIQCFCGNTIKQKEEQNNMNNNQEHTYIEEYLKGELDWELLVDAVGEDMARGVRIAENHLEKSVAKTIYADEDFDILYRERS